ncbi:hypothetical protein NHX12_014217 [Muraenolepis orangiensis]|uniref:Uncharacterized protein n=1 Tax=Muraenolepis orangiensis TaxID=630683 RepID=A0A9Q0DDC3_9TELE|nr:hypothetical protein NHX12_014217 [Muraenolepis orangiensis]
MKGDYWTGEPGTTGETGTPGPVAWTEGSGGGGGEEEEDEKRPATRGSRAQLGKRPLWGLLYCVGDMEQVDRYVEEQPFALQLALWTLRGVSRVTLANNPLSGALVLAALFWASPWQGVVGTVGALASTLTAVIIGQDGTLLFSGLSPLLVRWDVPVSVFPFNVVIVLYLLCTGPDNPYYPHYPATPAGALEPNATELDTLQVSGGGGRRRAV